MVVMWYGGCEAGDGVAQQRQCEQINTWAAGGGGKAVCPGLSTLQEVATEDPPGWF